MAVLRKYHSEGDDGETFVALEYAEIQATIAEGQARSTHFVWADAVRDAPMRRLQRTAGLIESTWCRSALVCRVRVGLETDVRAGRLARLEAGRQGAGLHINGSPPIVAKNTPGLCISNRERSPSSHSP